MNDKGTVYLYRTGIAVGAAMQTQIKINGQDSEGIGSSTFFNWDLDPGTYVFSCSAPESSVDVEVDVKVYEFYFLRQNNRILLSDGKVTLIEVDTSKGNQEVKRCKLFVSIFRQ